MLEYVTEPEWIAIIISIVALVPSLGSLVRWAWKRWREPFTPKTQSKRDRRNYDLLLHKYESYLDLMSDLIVVRAQVEAGPEDYTPELEEHFVRARDEVYNSLEKRSKREKDMGVFQLLDILEGRMVGAKEQREKRTALENRQADIEDHPLFIKR